MSTYSKVLLSGGSNGKNILVAGTATGSATTIHTATAGTTNMDEVWIWANNQSTASISCSLTWGGTTLGTDTIHTQLAPKDGLILVAPGILLQNTLVIGAYTHIANTVTLNGFVNRIIT